MKPLINWKTTLGAIVTLLSELLPLIGIRLSEGAQDALLTIGIFIIGFFAKDSNVTGGKTPQTPEAKIRV